ncbi:MAG: malic enzyme-like NAD(P)-binding protein [Nitrososphaera sp.]
MQAVLKSFPDCCIQFEDWKGTEALHYLSRYRDKVCCFNDYIQGTGSVTAAGLMNALRITGESIKDQRVLFLGAGSAGIGIADVIWSAISLRAYRRNGLEAISGFLIKWFIGEYSRRPNSGAEGLCSCTQPHSKSS